MTKTIRSLAVLAATVVSGRLHGLRAIRGRSCLQGQLPKLSRKHRNSEPRNRQDDGR